jgi:PKD repeat protein
MKRLAIIIPLLALILSSCYREPVADFIYSPANPVAGQDVVFTNTSSDAASFEWIFGDGSATNVVDPIYAFPIGGTYTVTLKAFGERGGVSIATASITVESIDPFADFDVSTTLPGAGDVLTDVVFVGEQVNFTNYSTDASSYLWEFGDGYTSTVASPSYSFDEAGTYAVTLHAYGTGQLADSYTKIIDVYDGINSTVRITVMSLEANPEDDYPVEDVEVTLYPTIDDWDDLTNPANAIPAITSPLGKCVLEGLNNQVYFVDAWGANHNNEGLGLSVDYMDWIATQQLTPDVIHDFVAYVEYVGSKKSLTLEKLSEKRLPRAERSLKKTLHSKENRDNKFSKPR